MLIRSIAADIEPVMVFVPCTFKPLTPVGSSENDCFAGDELEDAEETDIQLSSVSIGG